MLVKITIFDALVALSVSGSYKLNFSIFAVKAITEFIYFMQWNPALNFQLDQTVLGPNDL